MNALKRMDQRTLGTIAVVLALVLFVALNVLSSVTLTSQRVDLTENKLFTLSNGTREVLKSIDEPITVRLYISKSLTDLSPAHSKYATRVREFLQGLASDSRGKLDLRVIDPQPFSEAEDAAMAAGLQGVPLTKAGDLGYFGMAAANSTDDQGVIPFFNPEREPLLEYDLARIFYDLAHPKKKVVGVFSGIAMTSDPQRQRQWAVLEQMREFFDVRMLFGDLDKIDNDVDVLMVVHPSNLSDKTKFAIDQYLLKGGKAMVFVDPNSEQAGITSAMMGQPPMNTSSTFEPFFKTWGIEYDPTKFVGDRTAAMRVASEDRGRQVTSDYLAWLQYGPDYLDRNDVVTSQLNRLILAGAGAISLKEGTGLTIVPLIYSSPRSQMIDASLIRDNPNPLQLLQKFEPSGGRKILAARIQGKVKTAFPDGRPADKPKEGAPAEADKPAAAPADDAKPLTESAQPLNVIVVADSDLLADRFWLQNQQFFGQQVAIPTANNGDFVINGLEVLSGSNALIGLRSRGVSVHPFTLVQELQKDSELKYRRTEQTLLDKMKETEDKLGQVRSATGEGGVILTDQQKSTIEGFRSQLISIRQQLRDVQYALRSEIDHLETVVKVVNIWAMPLVVSIIAIVITVVRRLRRRRRYAAG